MQDTAEDRISMEQVFMRMAMAAAERSTCIRRVQVGCVVTDWEMTNVVGIGYNGPARGLPHDCGPLFEAQPDGRNVPVAPGTCTCIHAEVNALLKSPYDRGRLRLFTTLSPCAACARLILNTRVECVVYSGTYRTDEGLRILQSSKRVSVKRVLS